MTRLTFARHAVGVLGCLVVASASAGPGVWTSNGPYGGIMQTLLIDPAAPGNLYAATRGGIFRSIDGGSTWERATNGIVGSVAWTYALAMDGDAPNKLYSIDAFGHLVRSTDGAANWSEPGFTLPVDEVAQGIVDVPGAGNSGQFFIVTRTGTGAGGVRKSLDDGVTAPLLGGGLPAGADFLALAVDPSNPNLVVAGTDFSIVLPTDPSLPFLWRSVNGGGSWTSVASSPGLGGTSQVSAVAFGPGTSVYAIVDSQAWFSGDDGATWAPVPNQPSFFSTVLPHPSTLGTIYLGGPEGTVTATNAHTAAPAFGPMSTTLTGNATYTTAGGTALQADVRTIVADPAFPATNTLWTATDAAGIFRSVDGGGTWSSVGVNQGLAAVNVRALAVHPGPTTPRRIYAGFGDAISSSGTLFRSADDGATWPTANTGLRAAQLRGIALDPTTTATLGGTTLLASGRSALVGAQPFFAIRNSGIYRSRDGGNTWTTLEAGLPRIGTPPNDFVNLGTVRTVVYDPRSCGAPPTPVTGPVCATGPLRKAFFAATGFNTTVPDGGGGPAIPVTQFRIGRTLAAHDAVAANVSWAARDSGLPQPVYVLTDPDGPGGVAPFNEIREFVTPVPLVMSPVNSDVMYAGTFAQFDRVLTPVPSIVSGVFKSVDGGATWTHSSVGLPRYIGSTNTALDVLAMAISPTNPNVLWATVANLVTVNPPTVPRVFGIYKSVDGGATWTTSSAGIPTTLDIRALLVDPADADRLYAAGGGSESNPGAVYRSLDGGASWSSMSVGLPADSALSLALDPVNADLLHAGTNVGVWSIEQVADSDLDGAPNLNEDFAPNGGDGNNDGSQDAQQAAVGSSLVTFSAFEARAGRVGAGTLASGDTTRGGGGGYFTTVVQPGCSRAVDVQGLLAARFGRDPIAGSGGTRYWSYARDLVRFELPGCMHGVVDIIFHNLTAGGLPDFNDNRWTFRVYAPQVPGDDASIGWYDLGSRAQRVAANRWRVTLDAGQFGSYRPGTDSILFVGGPAFNDDRLFGNGFE